MTQFASKTPRDLNHDPEPWADESGMRWDSPGEGAWHMPRPEFDHVPRPGANEPNPILVEFRKWWSRVPDAWTLDRFIDALTLDERAPEAIRKIVREGTHRQRVHAYKVLTRLAALEG